MKIKRYELVNEDKVRRVIEGDVNRQGSLAGGIGDGDKALILAHYDRKGGFIRNAAGEKVKMGCFWDFKNNKPFEKPKVILVYRINGQEVEVPEGAPAPLAVRAQRILDAGKKGEAAEEEILDEDADENVEDAEENDSSEEEVDEDVAEEDLTPAQKRARTRAANKAREGAGGGDE